MPVTVRGKAKVEWTPDFTLVLSSPDGTTLPANGVAHSLIATLTNTFDGSPVPNRTIRFSTSPTPRVGDGARRTTGETGVVTISVSDAVEELVTYTASLIPKPPTSLPTLTANQAINWSNSPPPPPGFHLIGATPFASPSSYGVGGFADIRALGTASIDFVPTAFPGGATCTFHTTPGGGPGDGVSKSFVDTVFSEAEATLTVTSGAPGTWDYTITVNAPGPFTGQSSGTQPVEWA